MRVEDVEQGVGQLGEFVVDLVAHAGREQGERFDEALDVRIRAAAMFEHEPAGRRGILRRELAGHLADEQQLAFVVREKGLAHALLTAYCPEVNSSTVSKATSGAGS